MRLSKPLLEAILPANAKRHADSLYVAAREYKIDTPERLANWLGQMHVESAGFTRTRESLNYRASILISRFGRHRISIEDANRYGSIPGVQRADQQNVAACLYGGAWGREHLGNLYPDDAWRFIGRGFKQVTGRYNYTVVSTRLYGDDRLLSKPELLEQSDAAAYSAGDFWDWKGINEYADKMDIAQVTKTVTGSASQAFVERKQETERYLHKIKAIRPKADFSKVTGGMSTTARIIRDGE